MEGRNEGRDPSVAPPTSDPMTEINCNTTQDTSGLGLSSPLPFPAMNTHGSASSSHPSGLSSYTGFFNPLPYLPQATTDQPFFNGPPRSLPQAFSNAPPFFPVQNQGDMHPGFFQSPPGYLAGQQPPPPGHYRLPACNSAQPPWQRTQSAPPGLYDGQAYYHQPLGWSSGAHAS